MRLQSITICKKAIKQVKWLLIKDFNAVFVKKMLKNLYNGYH